METIANIFVKYLENLKIDKVFGVPGGVVEPFLNAISKKNSKIEPLNFASENQSCFIAQGYGEAKNSFGVCFSIWGQEKQIWLMLFQVLIYRIKNY